MTAALPRRRSTTFVEMAPLALVVAAEAAWISVVGGFVQVVRLQGAALGIAGLAAFVVLGIVLARVLVPRLGDRWPPVGLGVCLTAGAVGWLIAPEARSALLSGDVGRAIGQNPGGWVAGLAVLRGFADARVPLSPTTPARLLRLGIPGLAVLAYIGGGVVEPWRSLFIADTLVASAVFIACGTLALTLARQLAVGGDLPMDRRYERSWLILLVCAVAVATALALAFAGLVGQAILVVTAIALGPLLVAGLVFGTSRQTVRIVGICIAVAAFAAVLAIAFGGGPAEPPPVDPGPGVPVVPETDPGVIVGLGGIGIILALVAVLILIRLWMRPVATVTTDPSEVRTIDRGTDPNARTAPRRRRRHVVPTDALTAYLALVDDLAGHDLASRASTETPLEHARRLRLGGVGDLGLDLLAADASLVSFGGVTLTPSEDRRAIGRWRRLRTSLARDRIGATRSR